MSTSFLSSPANMALMFLAGAICGHLATRHWSLVRSRLLQMVEPATYIAMVLVGVAVLTTFLLGVMSVYNLLFKPDSNTSTGTSGAKSAPPPASPPGFTICQTSTDCRTMTVAEMQSRVDSDNGFSTAAYEIRSAAKTHLSSTKVDGQTGSYYLIELKDAKSQKTLQFPEKQFRTQALQEPLKEALKQFRLDVLVNAHNTGQDYKVYVVGEADRPSFQPEPLGEPVTVKVLQREPGSSNRFAKTPKTIRYEGRYDNYSLPNLRAWALARELAQLQKPGEVAPTILDGRVNPEYGEQFRKATLLLYVNWSP